MDKEFENFTEVFRNPGSDYRAVPFWAWNSSLEKETLLGQIDVMKEMGFGGFIMHVRQGLTVPYMSEEFLSAVKECVGKAEKENMSAWLYDEDRWPSGCAGGKVTKEKRFRQKYLLMTSVFPDDHEETSEDGTALYIASYKVTVDDYGFLSRYSRVDRSEKENVRHFFLMTAKGGEPRFNYQSYVDTFSAEAINRFIDETHKKYKEALGGKFGKSVPAIFTDEPQTKRISELPSGFSEKDAILPFTSDFFETFYKKYGEDLKERLPELFFKYPDDRDYDIKYKYFAHASERFCEAFTDNIGKWCGENGIALTGHLLGEDSLDEMSGSVFDVMRAYKEMAIPGIDTLCDDKCFTTAVQCRSVCRQYGRKQMMSELYGVTGWDFDFRGHKFQGDWQACLGVNKRVPHLCWETMKGEGKRDYPASIFYQSPWYKEYKVLEDHYARINAALDRGAPLCRIGVIFPIESYWLLRGSKEQTESERAEAENHFSELCSWLLLSSYDFDYVDEALLPDLCADGRNPFTVGKMKYDVMIVSDCLTLRPETLRLLSQFKESGGKLIIMGKTPEYENGKPSESAKTLAVGAAVIPHSKPELEKLLRPYKDVTIKASDGRTTNDLFCRVQKDKDTEYLYICHAVKPELNHVSTRKDIEVTVKGEYAAFVLDTFTGEIEKTDYDAENGKTKVYLTVYDLDSPLIMLKKTSGKTSYRKTAEKETSTNFDVTPNVKFSLSEPNVMLLDTAEYSIDGGEIQKEEEIMRIDETIRKKLGFQLRRTKFVQPWAVADSPEDHVLKLIYRVHSEIDTTASLAMENPEKAVVKCNGITVGKDITGWYADKEIKVFPLPGIRKGENRIEITLPFGLRTDIESVYLLGSFGVNCVGRNKYITSLPEKLWYGDASRQGLAFYGGDLEYVQNIEIKDRGAIEIKISMYRGALIRVFTDGKDDGFIAFPPFTLRTHILDPGTHKIKFVLYGNRYNTFSALHTTLADKKRVYIGPDYWRSAGEGWSYEYNFRPFGILKTPEIKFIKKGL